MGAVVNPVVDPVSGEPEFKHTPVMVEPFDVAWHGFVLSRRALDAGEATWWTRIQGRQFVRVRVGCYTSREAAEAMAAALRGHVTADAQPVELSPGAAVPGCTEESVGFLSGYDWELVDGTGPVAFGVSVAGVPATVVHDGERWRMVQQGEPPPGLSPAAATGDVVQRSVGGVAFAVLEDGGEDVVLCPGHLVAQVGGVAIVERGDVMVACRWLAGAGS